MRRQLLFWIMLLAGIQCLMAQDKEYMYEVGAGVGTDWMYGDVNRTRFFYNPAMAYNLQFRYNTNLRWSIAIDLSSDKLKGDSRDFNNVYPQDDRWTFDRHYWQLGIRPEFTFCNYGWGSDYREKHRVAPFLTLGMAFGWSAGDTHLIGSDGSLRQTDDKAVANFSIPLGIGVKWKMAPRWDLQLTNLWSKTFGDGIDGITDPYSLGSKSPANTDWIGSLMLSITFSFKERCLQCHNQND